MAKKKKIIVNITIEGALALIGSLNIVDSLGGKEISEAEKSALINAIRSLENTLYKIFI
jgi:hypothetical protein